MSTGCLTSIRASNSLSIYIERHRFCSLQISLIIFYYQKQRCLWFDCLYALKETNRCNLYRECVCVFPLKLLRQNLFFVCVYVWYRLHKSPKHLQNCHSSCRAKNLTNAVKHINKQWQRFQQNILNPMRKKMATVNETAKSRVKKKIFTCHSSHKIYMLH